MWEDLSDMSMTFPPKTNDSKTMLQGRRGDNTHTSHSFFTELLPRSPPVEHNPKPEGMGVTGRSSYKPASRSTEQE